MEEKINQFNSIKKEIFVRKPIKVEQSTNWEKVFATQITDKVIDKDSKINKETGQTQWNNGQKQVIEKALHIGKSVSLCHNKKKPS